MQCRFGLDNSVDEWRDEQLECWECKQTFQQCECRSSQRDVRDDRCDECWSQHWNFRPIHPVSVSGEFHDKMSLRSLIGSVNDVVKNSPRARRILVLTLLRHLPHGLIVLRRFSIVYRCSLIVYHFVYIAFSVGSQQVEHMVVFHIALRYLLNQ